MKVYLHILILFVSVFIFHCAVDANVAGTVNETDIGVYGTVVSSSGDPIQNVAVIIYDVSPKDTVIALDTVYSSINGYYRFNNLSTGLFLIEGELQTDSVTYKADIGSLAYDSILSKDKGVNLGIDTLYMTGAIACEVDMIREDKSDVHVYISGRSHSGYTDREGKVLLTGILPGSYTVNYKTEGYLKAVDSNAVSTAGDTIVLPVKTLQVDSLHVPKAPENLTIDYDSVEGVVKLSWNSVDDPNLEGYVVCRKDSSETAVLPKVISGNRVVTDTFYIDTVYDLTYASDITFQYQIRSQHNVTENRSELSWPKYATVLAKYGTVFTLAYYEKENGGYALKSNAPVPGHPATTLRFLFGNIDGNPEYELTHISEENDKIVINTYRKENSSWKSLNSYNSICEKRESSRWFLVDIDGDKDHDLLHLWQAPRPVYNANITINFADNGEYLLESAPNDLINHIPAEIWYATNIDNDIDEDFVQVYEYEDKLYLGVYEYIDGVFTIGKFLLIDEPALEDDYWCTLDYDGDGDKDVVQFCSTAGNEQVNLYSLVDGAFEFSLSEIDANHSGSDTCFAGDTDGDGDEEIICINNGAIIIYTFANNAIEYHFSGSIYSNSRYSRWLNTDYDNDGDLDLVQIVDDVNGFKILVYLYNNGFYTNSWESDYMQGSIKSYEWFIDPDGSLIQIQTK